MLPRLPSASRICISENANSTITDVAIYALRGSLAGTSRSCGQLRQSRHQACEYKRCAGAVKICSVGSAFHDLAFVQNGDALANSGDRRQIVRDVEDRHASTRDSSEANNCKISDCVITSSALVASSAISSAGRCRMAMAMSTRCACPR